MALPTTEVLLIRALLSNLKIHTAVPVMWCDNQRVIALAANPAYYAKTKIHWPWYTHLRKNVQNNQTAVYFVPYEDKIADVLTKGSTDAQFHSLRNKLNVLPRLYSLRVDVNRACKSRTWEA